MRKTRRSLRTRSLRWRGATRVKGTIKLIQGDVEGAHQKLVEAMTSLLRSGSESHIVATIFGFALVASAQEHYPLAATLHGAADTMLANLGEVSEPLEVRLRAADHQRLQHILGNTAFTEYYQRGQRLTREQVLALAMEPPDTS